MIYGTHLSVELCSLWQVFGSGPRLNIYKFTTATTKNNNLYIHIFSPRRSHVIPSFFT